VFFERVDIPSRALGADYLGCSDIGTFDRIIMNPPFSGAKDIAHIEHAFECLGLVVGW